MSDDELILRARQGDGRAIALLYERHAPRVYAVVRRLADDDASADDWAQETWLRAIRALPSFRGQSLFSTWLHRIAVNYAHYGRRRSRQRQERERAVDAAESLPAPAGPGGEQALLRARLERAIRELPPGMREVLVLHDVEGYTHEEIGTMLGVAPGTCKSQLFKARARMRTLLAPAPLETEGEEVCST